MRALGHHHDRRVPGLEALLDVAADLLDVERLLGDQDHVRAARDPGVQRDPARVAAHHLDDQRAVVALGRRVQPVDRLHRDVDRGVEAEGVVGRAEVVVDGLGHADDLDAVVVQLAGHAERVLAADRDQGVDAEAGQVRLDLLQAGLAVQRGLLRQRIGPRGAEDRAAAGQDAAHGRHVERLRVGLERSAPAVAEAHELRAVIERAGPHDRADDRVQPGAVAASGQDSDSHLAPPVLARLLARTPH